LSGALRAVGDSADCTGGCILHSIQNTLAIGSCSNKSM
jgi:hypothetical protein